MPPIQCFMLEPTDRVRRWLRRYHSTRGDAPTEEQCPSPANFGYHNAEVAIEDGPCVAEDEGYSTDPLDWPHDDPRWPTACACGYEFAESDEQMLQYHRIYRRADTGA